MSDSGVRLCFVFFSSRRRHTRLQGDWSSDVCSSDLLRSGDIIQAGSASIGFALSPMRQRGLRVRETLVWTFLAMLSLAQVAVIYWLLDQIGRASCRERV